MRAAQEFRCSIHLAWGGLVASTLSQSRDTHRQQRSTPRCRRDPIHFCPHPSREGRSCDSVGKLWRKTGILHRGEHSSVMSGIRTRHVSARVKEHRIARPWVAPKLLVEPLHLKLEYLFKRRFILRMREEGAVGLFDFRLRLLGMTADSDFATNKVRVLLELHRRPWAHISLVEGTERRADSYSAKENRA